MGDRRRTRTVAERFWPKVSKEPGGCWVWIGARNSAGYGNFKVGDRYLGAHRVSYELTRGPIVPIDGRSQLDHLCRNRACVNPDHLELVTPRENNRRSTSISAVNATKTHCVRGHRFDDPGVTYIRPDRGNRVCRPCHFEEVRQARQKARRARLEEKS